MSLSRKSSPQRVASAPTFIPLEAIHIASPCHADWDAMSGDARARFCGSCQKNVYNLSEMTRVEAETLILEKEGKLCVRYHQRADGTILTQDCPIGILQADARLKGRMAMASSFTALFTLCAALLSGAVAVPAAPTTAGAPSPVKGRPAPVIMGEAPAMMGVMPPRQVQVMGRMVRPSTLKSKGASKAKTTKKHSTSKKAPRP